MKIKVKNELGAGKEIKLGYSWTMFFGGSWFQYLEGIGNGS